MIKLDKLETKFQEICIKKGGSMFVMIKGFADRGRPVIIALNSKSNIEQILKEVRVMKAEILAVGEYSQEVTEFLEALKKLGLETGLDSKSPELISRLLNETVEQIFEQL